MTEKRGPGRPAYTPEVRLRVSFLKLRDSITLNENGCWITDLKDVAVRGVSGQRLRVRPAAFMWRALLPNRFDEGDFIERTCVSPGCCNPAHQRRWARTNNDKASSGSWVGANVNLFEEILWHFLDTVHDLSKHYRQREFLAKLYKANPVSVTDVEACERRGALLPDELPEDDEAFNRILLSVGIVSTVPSSA